MKTVFILFLVFFHPDTIRVQQVETASQGECEAARAVAMAPKPGTNHAFTGRVINAFCIKVTQ